MKLSTTSPSGHPLPAPSVAPAFAEDGSRPSVLDTDAPHRETAPGDLARSIAMIVSRLRRNSRMTTEELAVATRIPVQVLFDIEAGGLVPSLRALWALARVFEVPFRVLIAAPGRKDSGFHVLRADAGQVVVSDRDGFRSRALCSAGDPREPEVYEITLAPGCLEEASAHPEETCEHVVVVRGRLRIRSGDSIATLREGDALFFGADVPHSYENPGPVEAVALLTVTNGGDWIVA